MSFIKKAVKKVFKVVKKIVKSKIFKIAAVAALTFFTAGVVMGGFGAFTGVSTIGEFFGAVGSTISQGFTGTVGKLFGAGGTPSTQSLAAAGVNPAEAASVLSPVEVTGTRMGAGYASGIGGAADFAAMGGKVALQETVLKEASKPLLSRIFGSIMAPTTAGSMMRTGLMMGAQAWMQNDYMKDQKAYRDSRNVWGTAAFGGDGQGWDLFSPTAGAPQATQQAARQMQQPEALLSPELFDEGGAPPPLPEGQNVQRAQQAGLLATAAPQQAPPAQAAPPAPGGGAKYDPYGGVKV